MTGGELIPVAQATASLAKKALDDSADTASLQSLAADSPNMKAAAETYARRVAVKQAVLLQVYQPLARYLGISREYFDTQFHADMGEKVVNIPEEHLATPSPSVAIPAMQGLGYSIDEPELKEMYLALLATATDDRVAEDAHPSFAEIIKQLSPREASLLLSTLRREVRAVVRLMRKAKEGTGETTEMNYLLPLVQGADHSLPSELPSLPVWMDNWVRLGLIEVDYGRSLVDESQYAYVEERPEFKRLAAQDSRGKDSLSVGRGIIRATDFGKRFLAAVSYDGVSLEGAPGAAEPPASEPVSEGM